MAQADRVVDLIYTKYLKGIISYQNITRVETYLSQRKIATLIGVSYDTVRYHMEDMKKRKIIVRKGNGQSGKWISRINGLRKEKSKMIKILFICHGSTADSRELAGLVGQNRANRGNRSGKVLRFYYD